MKSSRAKAPRPNRRGSGKARHGQAGALSALNANNLFGRLPRPIVAPCRQPRPLVSLARGSCCPVRHHQPRHALELTAVRRNQCRAAATRLRGDEIMIMPDRLARFFQVSAECRRRGRRPLPQREARRSPERETPPATPPHAASYLRADSRSEARTERDRRPIDAP